MIGFKEGDKVTANYLEMGYTVTGKIIKIIEPRVPLSDSDLKLYAEITPEHKAYKSVRGEHCSVYRLVIRKEDQSHTIVPVNLKYWDFKHEKF